MGTLKGQVERLELALGVREPCARCDARAAAIAEHGKLWDAGTMGPEQCPECGVLWWFTLHIDRMDPEQPREASRATE